MDKNRVSVSLLIDDDKLYNSFILPNKHQKTLNKIILKCLKAYYYDSDIRARIIGGTPNTEAELQNPDIAEKFSAIKNSLLMQDFYVQQMGSLMEEGVDLSEDVLQRANQQATQQGDFSTQETGSGSTMLLPNNTQNTPQTPINTETAIKELTDKVNTIYNLLGGMTQAGMMPMMLPMFQPMAQQPMMQQPIPPQTTSQSTTNAQQTNVDDIEIKIKPKETKTDTSDNFSGFAGFDSTNNTEITTSSDFTTEESELSPEEVLDTLLDGAFDF